MMKELTLENINVLADGDTEFKEQLIEAYVNSFNDFFREIPLALETNMAKQLREAIHKVRSGVRMLEANALDKLLDKLDAAAKADKLATLDKTLFLDNLSGHAATIAELLKGAVVKEPQGGGKE